MKSRLQPLFFVAILTIISGCATGRYTVPAEGKNYPTQANRSLVIFMRPSNLGSSIASSLFELKGNETAPEAKFIGTIGANEKIAYYAEPGKNKRFMVVSENADFMDADLGAGKVYYTAVTPRMGWWKARFSLRAFKRVSEEPAFQLDSQDLVSFLKECQLVEPNQNSYVWAKEHADDIHQKALSYLQKWAEIPKAEKQQRKLQETDGLDRPL